MRPTENILKRLPIKETSALKDTLKVEERLKQQRQEVWVHKRVIPKKLKFDSLKKPKLPTLMTAVQTSKENMIHLTECNKIHVDPPSED
ncbi:hypothetical protein AVEN_88004-1 [Araneus ventricosus]|uniref:Uncharacterized protein n=1 Tax=Araneus ventricosus TaxID=182803 RepID=A0A4Y2FXX6_ARAVE|nr:hypothetical protein AVEN_88004-1 [Araneus ventricosus]